MATSAVTVTATAGSRSPLEQLRAFYLDGSTYEIGQIDVVSQLDHALQCATNAQKSGADKETVVAALLHDIGWKLAGAHPSFEESTGSEAEVKAKAMDERLTASSVAARLGILSVTGGGDADSHDAQQAMHDVIGATYLRMIGLPEKVAHLVEGHVLTKRYLCFKEPEYYDKLSESSKFTLTFQGGVMTKEEAAIFESDPLFETCVMMRRWDEDAKNPDASAVSFADFEPLISELLSGKTLSAAETRSSFVRDGNTVVAVDKEAL